MLRLYRVYDTEKNCWVGREDEGSPDPNYVAEDAHFQGDGSSRYEAREYGDFIQVTPEVKAAAGELRKYRYYIENAIADPNCRAILYWALAGIPEEQGDGEG